MPVTTGNPRQRQKPSCMEMALMGVKFGSLVGGTFGFLIGCFSAIRYGPGPNGYMGTILRPMIQSGAFFGFFFAIGHVLRCDDMETLERQRPFSTYQKDRAALLSHLLTRQQQQQGYLYRPIC